MGESNNDKQNFDLSVCVYERVRELGLGGLPPVALAMVALGLAIDTLGEDTESRGNGSEGEAVSTVAAVLRGLALGAETCEDAALHDELLDVVVLALARNVEQPLHWLEAVARAVARKTRLEARPASDAAADEAVAS